MDNNKRKVISLVVYRENNELKTKELFTLREQSDIMNGKNEEFKDKNFIIIYNNELLSQRRMVK